MRCAPWWPSASQDAKLPPDGPPRPGTRKERRARPLFGCVPRRRTIRAPAGAREQRAQDGFPDPPEVAPQRDETGVSRAACDAGDLSSSPYPRRHATVHGDASCGGDEGNRTGLGDRREGLREVGSLRWRGRQLRPRSGERDPLRPAADADPKAGVRRHHAVLAPVPAAEPPIGVVGRHVELADVTVFPTGAKKNVRCSPRPRTITPARASAPNNRIGLTRSYRERKVPPAGYRGRAYSGFRAKPAGRMRGPAPPSSRARIPSPPREPMLPRPPALESSRTHQPTTTRRPHNGSPTKRCVFRKRGPRRPGSAIAVR